MDPLYFLTVGRSEEPVY